MIDPCSRAAPPPLALRASGPLACFTRPELKSERVTYPLITPSAARGLLESVLWKPQMRWRIERVKVLSPIAFTSFRRNEVGVVASAPSRSVIESGGEYEPLVVEDRRQQRNTVALRDVDYVIEARIELTSHASSNDSLAKYVAMFQRRLERGQQFQQGYFGCREFFAQLEPVDENTPAPIDETRDLGLMLWDMEFVESNEKKGPRRRTLTWRTPDGIKGGFARPVFFAARLVNGVMEVPPTTETAERSIVDAAVSSQKEGGRA